MSHSVGPEPDPRLSLESLEAKLRALPRADVPSELPAKLLASIPAGKATVSSGIATSRWFLIGAITVMCIAVSIVGYFVAAGLRSTNPKPANESASPADSLGTKQQTAPSSKAVKDFEQAVRVDPYNADAWFALAKAQANAQLSEDAIASAQKAIDVARSRNRSDLVGSVQAWLRSYRASQGKQSTR